MNCKMTPIAFVAFAFLVTLVAATSHAKEKGGSGGSVHGVISFLGGNSFRINVDKDTDANTPKTQTFTVDKSTTFSGGGKEGTFKDLRVGQTVTVKAKKGKATSVEVDMPTTKPS